MVRSSGPTEDIVEFAEAPELSCAAWLPSFSILTCEGLACDDPADGPAEGLAGEVDATADATAKADGPTDVPTDGPAMVVPDETPAEVGPACEDPEPGFRTSFKLSSRSH